MLYGILLDFKTTKGKKKFVSLKNAIDFNHTYVVINSNAQFFKKKTPKKMYSTHGH